MINLASESNLTKWFIWSCDHLPFTVTRIYSGENDHQGIRRTGVSYVENGTTLCHIFWAALWVPIAIAALAGFLLFILAAMHFYGHQDFVASHPDASPLASVASYFIPEIIALVFATAMGIFILSVIGGSKVGFFALLWQYLKGIKQRVCPLVRFNNVERGS